MKFLKQMINSTFLRNLVVVFLAGVLVLVSTACGTSRPTAARDNISPKSDLSGQGMYPHKDTERDTTAADAKADRLIRKARQQRQNVQSPKDVVDRVSPDKPVNQQIKDVGESAKRAAEDVGESAKQRAEETAESARRGMRNIKENTQDAAKSTADAVDRATSR
jgi:hypothetical protein